MRKQLFDYVVKYASQMEPSTLALFPIILVRVHRYLLKGYIHRHCRGPTILALCGRCTGRCSIEPKNLGGTIHSNLHKICALSLSNISVSSTRRVVDIRSFKNRLNSLSTCHTLIRCSSRKVIYNIHRMNT